MRAFIFSVLAFLIAAPALAAGADPVISDPGQIDGKYPPAMAELSLASHGQRMNGFMYIANGPGPHPTVVLLHGYPGNEQNLDLAQAMRRAGWNVLFFHYRGAWGSAGDFSFAGAIGDVAAALDYLRDPATASRWRVDSARLALVGHSLGGFLALSGAARDPRVACVASIDGVNLGVHGRRFLADPASAKGFIAYADDLRMLAGWTGKKAVAELTGHIAEFDLLPRMKALAGRAVLLVAAGPRSVVDMAAHITPLVEALHKVPGARVRFEVLNTDHPFSDKRIALAHLLVDWLRQSCG